MPIFSPFQIILNLTFSQAARGIVKEAVINVVDKCPKCKGTRSMPGTKAGRCTWCNGSGMETISTGKICYLSRVLKVMQNMLLIFELFMLNPQDPLLCDLHVEVAGVQVNISNFHVMSAMQTASVFKGKK